jgi:hypothetical protein
MSNNIIQDLDFEIIPNKDNLTELERTILINDYDKTVNLISRGATIYNNMLCNGYLNRKYNYSHTKCITNICCRNAVFYALYINICIVKHIYQILLNLSIKSSDNDIDIEKIINIIRTCDCGCKSMYRYKSYYDSNYFDFKKISQSMNLDQYIQNKNDTSLFTNILEFKCLHQTFPVNNDDYNTSFNELIKLYNSYLSSVKIVNLLLNQQAYETYKYHLKLKSSDIINEINKLYDDDYISIDYINQCEKKSVLLLTLIQPDEDNDKLIESLIGKATLTSIEVLPENINELLIKVLSYNHFRTFNTIIKYCTYNNLTVPSNILINIIQHNKMSEEYKITAINLLMEKNITIDTIIINEALKSELSLKILELISKNSSFSNQITQNIISYAIKNNKVDELNMLLTLGRKSLIDGENTHQPPLITFLNETKEDTDITLQILNTLLHHGPNLEIMDTNGNTTLLLATKKGRYYTVEKLIERGADAFVKDKYGDNVLHLAIKQNNLAIVKIVSCCKSNGLYLVNETDKYMRTPLLLALTVENSINIIEHLVRVEEINLNYYDEQGMNIMHHILSNINIDNTIKYKLFEILMDSNISLTDVNLIDSKPIVIKAVDNDMFHIVVMIMNKLIKLGDINIGDDDIINAIKTDKTKNMIVKSNKPNFYSLVILYLKQNLHRIAIKDKLVFGKIDTTEMNDLDSEVDGMYNELHDIESILKKQTISIQNEHIIVRIIFVILFMIMTMIKTNKIEILTDL